MKFILISGDGNIINFSELFHKALNLSLCGVIGKIHQVEASLKQSRGLSGCLALAVVVGADTTDQILNSIVIEFLLGTLSLGLLFEGDNRLAGILPYGVLYEIHLLNGASNGEPLGDLMMSPLGGKTLHEDT